MAQQIPPQQQMFMQAQAYQRPAYSDPEARIHIAGIHESITEEILWKMFKDFGTIHSIKVMRDKETQRSKRVAKMVFVQPEAAKEARKEKNLSYLIPQGLVKNNKRIMVSKDKDFEQLKAMQKHNLFISGLPQIEEQPKILYNFFTQYGEIHTLKIAYKKDEKTLAGHGFILLENAKDAETLLKGPIEYQGHTLNISNYRLERSNHGCNFYIKEFSDKVFTEAEIQDQKKIDESSEQLKKKIESVFSRFGQVKSIVVNVHKDEKKPFAFVSFEDASIGEKVDAAIEDGSLKKNFSNDKFYIKQNNKNKSKASKYQENMLHIKNIKFFEDEAEQERNAQRVTDILAKYGKVQKAVLVKGSKPKESLEDSCFTIANFQNDADALKFLTDYITNKETHAMFRGEKPDGNVTICLPKAEKQRMIRSFQQYKQNIKTFQQQAIIQDQQQRMNYQSAYSQSNRNQGGYNGQKKFHSANYRGGQNANQPNRGGQGFNNQQGRNFSAGNRPAQNQQRNFNNQGQAPRPIGQNPRPINNNEAPAQQEAQPQSNNVSLEDLKSNLDQFTKLDPAKQSQVLGNLIYPKVKEIVNQQKEPENFAAKITGMLIDFSVFEVTDILDILESQEELKERVVEAIELIKQQAN